MKEEICPACQQGQYDHGSALYRFYSCGHAYEKPLNDSEKGRMVYYPSPHKSK